MWLRFVTRILMATVFPEQSNGRTYGASHNTVAFAQATCVGNNGYASLT